MAENPRTETVRAHDDSALIEGMIADPDAVASSAGGDLQTDIGSKADLKRAVEDPEGDTRPEKADDIANDQAYESDRAPDR